MFTGIIEDQGIVKTFKKLKDYQLVVSSKNKFKGIKKGSSICCDGVCLTVHTIKRLSNKIISSIYDTFCCRFYFVRCGNHNYRN